jgi:hypothetical protein
LAREKKKEVLFLGTGIFTWVDTWARDFVQKVLKNAKNAKARIKRIF